MKTLLKEPLLHFLLLGAVLFLVYSPSASEQDASGVIKLTASKRAQLEYSFEKTRQRKPSKQELNALINSYYKEQVAYQKGVEMGLLNGDGVIQRRVQQKVEFIVEDAVNNIAPSDEQLADFLRAHSEDYRSEKIFSFSQLYFDTAKHVDVTVKMDEVLRQINSLSDNGHNSAKPQEVQLLALSDNIYLDYQYTNISYALVARYFGSQFADALVTMPMDTWQEEIKSGYGLHLVQLTMRRGGELQPLDKVREQVKQDWLNEQRKVSLGSFYQQLFVEYDIDLTDVE